MLQIEFLKIKAQLQKVEAQTKKRQAKSSAVSSQRSSSKRKPVRSHKQFESDQDFTDDFLSGDQYLDFSEPADLTFRQRKGSLIQTISASKRKQSVHQTRLPSSILDTPHKSSHLFSQSHR